MISINPILIVLDSVRLFMLCAPERLNELKVFGGIKLL